MTGGASSSRCSAARRPLGRSRRARSSLSGCGAIGVLASLAADCRLRRPALRRSCRACNNWAGPSGRNVQIDYRWAAGQCEAARKYAAELVALAPDVILAGGSRPRRRCCRRPATIPIVFVHCPRPGRRRASSTAWRGRAATPPGSPSSNTAWAENGWSCSKRSRRADARGGASRSGHYRRDRPVRGDPVRGAVGHAGDPDQPARAGEIERSRRGFRARFEWRSDRDRQRPVGPSSRSDRHACGPTQAARGLLRRFITSPPAA